MNSFVKELLYEFKVDFIGLQETIKSTYPDSFFRKIDLGKLFAWKWLPAIGKSGGILCGVRVDRFDIINVETGNFSLVANVFDKKFKKSLVLATVPGPAHDEGKEQFLTELAHICNNRHLPMLIRGDFNILRYSSEKK